MSVPSPSQPHDSIAIGFRAAYNPAT
jgi:hypothetical protein